MTFEAFYQSVLDASSEKDRPFIGMNVGKDGKSMSVYFYKQLTFRVTLGKKISHIVIDQEYIVNPEAVSLNFTKVEPEQKLRIYLDELFNHAAFLSLIPSICKVCRDMATVEPFGCCSHYIECSDARECLHWRDEEYLGCMYRKNLEAGRIFYGRNANFRSEPDQPNLSADSI